jgi:hypothetical protein
LDLAYKGLGDIAPPHSRAVNTTPSTCFALCVLNRCCNQLQFQLCGLTGGREEVHGGQILKASRRNTSWRSHHLGSRRLRHGGRLGAHAHALLGALATSSLVKGRTPLAARRSADAPHPMLVSLLVRRWPQLLSTWLHLALSRMAMRLLCPATASRLQYI